MNGGKVLASPAAPFNAFGLASDQGYACNWTEACEADFGAGFIPIVCLSFSSGRVGGMRQMMM